MTRRKASLFTGEHRARTRYTSRTRLAPQASRRHAALTSSRACVMASSYVRACAPAAHRSTRTPRADYDLDGPAPIGLGDELAHAISELRPRTVAIEACTLDDFLAPSGLPPSAASSLSGFLAVLQSRCAGASDAVGSGPVRVDRNPAAPM